MRFKRGRIVLFCALIGTPSFLSAQKILPDAVSDLSNQIAKRASAAQKAKIAVIPFRELGGQPTVLGTYIAEELVTSLVNTGNLDLVERTTLEKVFGELKLNESGAIDPSAAKQVGKLVGADAIVTGTITDLQSYVAVNCRMIDTQTGRIFAAAEARIAKDDDVKKIMGMPLESGASQPSVGGHGTASQAPPKRPEFATDMYRLTAEPLRKVGDHATLSLTVESVATKPILFLMGDCRALDENGVRWDQQDRYSNQFTWGFGIDMVPGTKLRTELKFTTADSTNGKLFTLVCSEMRPENGRHIVLRDIAIH